MKKTTTFGLVLFTLTLSFLNLARANPAANDPNDQQVKKIYSSFLNVEKPLTRLSNLDQMAGPNGSVSTQPWSGYYWPLIKGSFASPGSQWNETFWYQKGFNKHLNKFFKRMDSIMANSENLDSGTIEKMAPTEKYDLYLGDHTFALTHAIWQAGQDTLARFEKMERWEGSCQGWSSASIYSPRPESLFSVMSLDGKYLIPFYPEDLRALETLLWANSFVQDFTTLAGGRCWNKKPEVDRSNGHVLDRDCRGVNPGVFHLALLQLVGVQKKSFIMNRTNSTEVWNQPILAYQLQYFNPSNLHAGNLAESTVERTALANDPFSAYRNERTRAFVGVNLKLNYIHGTKPTRSETNSTADDRIDQLELSYDLELDQNGEVLGGEWIGMKQDTIDHDGDESGNSIASVVGSKRPTYPGFIWKFKSADPMAFSVADPPAGTRLKSIPQKDLLTLHLKAAANKAKVFKIDEKGQINGVLYEELKPQVMAIVVNDLVRMSRRK